MRLRFKEIYFSGATEDLKLFSFLNYMNCNILVVELNVGKCLCSGIFLSKSHIAGIYIISNVGDLHKKLYFF